MIVSSGGIFSSHRTTSGYPATETSAHVPGPRAVRPASASADTRLAHGIGRAKVTVHADDAGQRGAEEIEVAHHGGRASRRVRDGDTHRAVNLRPKLIAVMLELFGSAGMRGASWSATLNRASFKRPRAAPLTNIQP